MLFRHLRWYNSKNSKSLCVKIELLKIRDLINQLIIQKEYYSNKNKEFFV